MYEGFYKVAHNGSTYVTATMFNPATGEEHTICVRDYDYADGSRDNDEIYDMPIDEAARRAWKHKHGEILVGDTIRVFKGRKVKIGRLQKSLTLSHTETITVGSLRCMLILIPENAQAS